MLPPTISGKRSRELGLSAVKAARGSDTAAISALMIRTEPEITVAARRSCAAPDVMLARSNRLRCTKPAIRRLLSSPARARVDANASTLASDEYESGIDE